MKPVAWIVLLTLFFALLTASFFLGFSPILPLFATLGAAGIVLLLDAPLLLLCFLFIVRMSLDYSSQFYAFTILDYTVSLSQLLGGAIAILGLFLFVVYKRDLARFPLIFPMGLLFLWGIATTTYSIAPGRTIAEILRYFDLFVLAFFAFIAVRNTADFKRLLQAILFSSIVPILFAAYQFAFSLGFQDADVSLPRIFGTFSHPNVFSLYLFSVIVFATLYAVIFAHTSREKTILGILLLALAITLLLTFARVAWVALFIFGFLLAIVRYRLFLFPLLLIPGVLFVFSPAFQNRVQETLSPDPDSSIVWRETLWHDVSTKSIQDGRYYLGSGLDTFPIVSEALRGERFGSNDPHNDFVKFFVEGGIVGLGVFILYLLSLLFILGRRFIQSQPENALRFSYGVFILFFLTLEIAGLSDNVYKNTPVQWIFFTVFGALLSMSRKK